MFGRLHRVALWLRLTLVCLVLTGISAPAPAMGYREAVVAIAGATSRPPATRLAAPPPPPAAMGARAAGVSLAGATSRRPETRLAAPAPAPRVVSFSADVKVAPPPVMASAPNVGRPAASISPLPPRRIFLLNRALLC